MMTTEKKVSPIPHAQRTQLLQKTQSNKSWKLYVWRVNEQGKPFAQHTSAPLVMTDMNGMTHARWCVKAKP